MARTKRRKHRTHVPEYVDPSKKGPPKSFVFWRGQHGLVLKALEADLRRLMQPHTATNLKESKRNQLKDFVNIAGPLGVNQFLILTATEHSCYLRIGKVPRGPTLTMRIQAYSLMRDVVAAQLRPRLPDSLWKSSPLVVMNNFVGEEHLKLATVLFQNLFPAINVQTTKLSTCQRVVLLSYDKETKRISFRHYSISAQPSGVTKSVKALIGRRQVPDMSNLQDVSELLTRSGYGSESEGEEAAESRVTLAQDLGRGNIAARQSRVRLQEIGPRMELEIVKVEEGLCTGQVLFHQHIQKSATEAAEQEKRVKTREEVREQRKRQQEENVRKKAEQQKRKAVSKEGEEGQPKKRRKKEWWEVEIAGRKYEEDDDIQAYRDEVGEEPEELYGLKRKDAGGRKPDRADRASGPAARGGRGRDSGARGDRGGRGDRGDRSASRGRGGSAGRGDRAGSRGGRAGRGDKGGRSVSRGDRGRGGAGRGDRSRSRDGDRAGRGGGRFGKGGGRGRGSDSGRGGRGASRARGSSRGRR